MDFSYDEPQQAVRDLADRLFGDLATPARLKELEASAPPEGPLDDALWSELAGAGLLSIGLAEDVGGAGLDFVAVCLVVEALGRTAAHVPAIETMVYGAEPIERFGTPEQRRRWLPRVAQGSLVATAALVEVVGDLILTTGNSPATTATPVGRGRWRLDGTKACVPAGMSAGLVLVPASRLDAHGQPTGPAVFLVDPEVSGVRRQAVAGAYRVEALFELDGVVVDEADLLGGPTTDGSMVLLHLAQHATVALCLAQAGACAAAVELTAQFTKTREQFGKPIASFQAVGQRAADAYVDAQAVRLTAWQAAWRLSRGLPAATEVATAKYWAAEGGQRVVHGATHLHGGVGVDREYALHRFFLWTEQIELTLGRATESLLSLGRLLGPRPRLKWGHARIRPATESRRCCTAEGVDDQEGGDDRGRTTGMRHRFPPPPGHRHVPLGERPGE